MVALKAGDIDRFIARPPDTVPLVLVFGPDVGLVSERAQALVTHASGGVDDPFSLVKLDAADIASDPARLIDEAMTISMFGGRRVVFGKVRHKVRHYYVARGAGEAALSMPAVGALDAQEQPVAQHRPRRAEEPPRVARRRQHGDVIDRVEIRCEPDPLVDLRTGN